MVCTCMGSKNCNCVIFCNNVLFTRYLQSVTIPEFSYTDATDLVGVIQEHLKLDTLTSDQVIYTLMYYSIS